MAQGMETLGKSMEDRKNRLENASDLIHATRDLHEKFGKDVLRSGWERYESLEKSINSSDLRIVVIGEFSRGKSSLLNALLDMRALPTANEATTAINTYIYGLEPGEEANWFRIVYRDGHTECLESNGDDSETLRKWGTELDREHKDLRREVELIEFHKSHPLLNLGLVLIDTPGLASLEEHHEAITHRAIDSAHIAIWLQSATQLGGTSHEWDFLRKTVRKNFRKFLTVITHWDKILDPEDDFDRKKPLSERIEAAMQTLCEKFREALPDLSDEELQTITGRRNLFGVSSLWALSQNLERREQSGMGALSSRIGEMGESDEAMAEIFYKPLTGLANIQVDLKEFLEDSMKALDNDKSLKDQERDIQSLQQEIRGFEQEQINLNQTSSADHERHREQAMRDLEDLTMPLRNLRDTIESRITLKYVKDRIRERAKSIGLPPDLEKEYRECLNAFNAGVNDARVSMENRLAQLALDYENAMRKYMDTMKDAMTSLDIEMPGLDIDFSPDYSDMERFYSNRVELDQRLAEEQEKMTQLEDEIRMNKVDRLALESAREAVERAERRLRELGPEPAPNRYYKHECIKKGGMYSSDQYGDVPYEDSSNVEQYRSRFAEYERMIQDREVAQEAIIAREQAKTGRRMSAEAARRKLDNQLKRMQAELEESRKKGEESEAEKVEETHKRLIQSTAGKLDGFVRAIERNMQDAVRSIFENHQKFLAQCVEEGIAEKMRGKKESLVQALELKKLGEAEMEKRRHELAQALETLAALQAKTEELLSGN